ncbi:hypothetical protein [Thiolinea disciformis]|uniref:hypothetical protein n=1 Tax=Thiolinea disciformis TaxID=125614 RepID=UPI0003785EC5|nr:hypothetical protein [Thiolinea disciformis]
MQAGIEGGLHIVMNVERTDVHIRSTRPLQAINQLLQGKTMDQALALIPLLFHVCGTAHGLAALKANAALFNKPIDPEHYAALQDLVALETGREQVQRILLDWSAWRGLKPELSVIREAMQFLTTAKQTWFKAGNVFRADSELLQTKAQREWLKQRWRQYLEQHIFAVSLERFQAFNRDDLQTWIHQAETIPAHALRRLKEKDWGGLGANSLVPELENSVLARQVQQPLIQQVLREFGNGVLSRWLALLLELVRGTTEVDDHAVPAARGNLRHQVALDANQFIQCYSILAPTEVNFANDGVVAAGLKALCRSRPLEDLKDRANLWIQAVDPCVSYTLEIQTHA